MIGWKLEAYWTWVYVPGTATTADNGSWEWRQCWRWVLPCV